MGAYEQYVKKMSLLKFICVVSSAILCAVSAALYARDAVYYGNIRGIGVVIFVALAIFLALFVTFMFVFSIPRRTKARLIRTMKDVEYWKRIHSDGVNRASCQGFFELYETVKSMLNLGRSANLETTATLLLMTGDMETTMVELVVNIIETRDQIELQILMREFERNIIELDKALKEIYNKLTLSI